MFASERKCTPLAKAILRPAAPWRIFVFQSLQRDEPLLVECVAFLSQTCHSVAAVQWKLLHGPHQCFNQFYIFPYAPEHLSQSVWKPAGERRFGTCSW